MCVLIHFRNSLKLQNLKSDKLYLFSNEEIVSICSCVKCELMITSINPLSKGGGKVQKVQAVSSSDFSHSYS